MTTAAKGSTQGEGKAKARRDRTAKGGKAKATQAAEGSEDPGRQGRRQEGSVEGQGTDGQGRALKILKTQVELEKVAFKAARAKQGRWGARRVGRRSTGVG